MRDASVLDLFAGGFVLAAFLLWVRAARTTNPRSRARRWLALSSLVWACGAYLYPRDPHWVSYLAMGVGGVLIVVAAFVSARDG